MSSLLRWAPDDRVRDQLILVQGAGVRGVPGERRPAIDMSTRGTIPCLRARIGSSAPCRGRVRFLSNLLGLVPADRVLAVTEAPISEKIAQRLRLAFRRWLWEEFERDGVPREVLILADTVHTILVADLDLIPRFTRVVFDDTIEPSHWPAVTDRVRRLGLAITPRRLHVPVKVIRCVPCGGPR